MLQYVNGFSCAMEVTTIVMGKVTAQRLLEGLREMLEDEDV